MAYKLIILLTSNGLSNNKSHKVSSITFALLITEGKLRFKLDVVLYSKILSSTTFF